MRNLTEEEILVLAEEFNLADGHAYRDWSPAEAAVIAGAADTFRQVDRRHRARIERDYLRDFIHLAGQSMREDRFEFNLCFTASTALEVVANYLRLNRLSAALVEPCFDNLHDILARHQVALTALPESVMDADGDEFARALRAVHGDAIFLVSPNNPTGTQIGRANFALLLDHCRAHGRLLILDATFRFYVPDADVYDQYAMAADAGVDCIVIEDTGKTWPTLEIKAPFFAVSAGLAKDVARIYSDFVLHVSPAAVGLLHGFLRIPRESGLAHVRGIVETNRRALHESLHGTFLQPAGRPYMSVAWLRIVQPRPTSAELKQHLAAGGVHVLAGNQFFWSCPARGDSFIRVALARDPAMFGAAAARLGALCAA